MPEKRSALGRGLSALIPDAASVPPPSSPRDHTDPRPTELDLDLLTPNPRQPRTQIDEARLEELAQSIRANGIIQPIVVRRVADRYEIVAGERRWRAAQRAGLMKVPVSIKDVADDQLLAVALVENIQREDLNPVEAAHAYRRLHEELGLSHDAIAAAVGKDRATVANFIRLLRLPAEVLGDLGSGILTMGHARALLSLRDEPAQRRVARDVVARNLSVRETEAHVRRELQPPAERQADAPVADPNTRAAENTLKVALGTRVRIVRKGQAGRIEIEFKDERELQRLYEHLTAR